MARTDALAPEDLEYLRGEALRNVLLFASAGAYAWFGALLLGHTRFAPAFGGPALLACGLAVALATRAKRLTLAAAAVIAGMLAADLYTTWQLGVAAAPYLLAVVVALTGLLFSLRVVVGMTVLSGGLVVAIGSLHWGYAPRSAELLIPVIVIATVGILSALSVRNLYQVLSWAWERATLARQNEEQLRERRGELARTAKALDEACQRLEYLNYDLAQAREAAEEARQIKQQFTTAVSHELRTPLNVIVALSELMYLSPQSYEGVALPRVYRGDAREIYRAGQHLLRLIDDVLALSQVEAQRLEAHLEPVSLAEVAEEAAAIVGPLLRGEEVQLRVEVPTDLPPVLMDRARIRQVLLNLLSNARRFTDKGSITVRALQDEGWARVTVADTGTGIPPALHGRVFEEFSQVDASATRKREGTGLGLAISKRFVELHGGRIWVESEGVPGLGARFHFTLPLAHAAAGLPGLQRTPLSLKAPDGRRPLLVVEEDQHIIGLLNERLEGYQALPVARAGDLPALVGEVRPQAIVLNAARGPQVWEQAEGLQRSLGPGAPPVIVCPLVGDRQLGEALGVDAYLVKPIATATLAALLERMGEVQRILIVDDDPQMAHLLSRMVRSIGRPVEVDRAYGGGEALLKMKRHTPDLVLLDLVMPELDGRTLLGKMRELPALRGVRVAVVTAQERTPQEERQLGGTRLQVTSAAGFTNEESLHLLRALLAGLRDKRAAGSVSKTVQNGQEVGLGDGLVQVGDGAQ